MAAAKGNKYNQHGKTRKEEFLHCRISKQDKKLFVERSEKEELGLCPWIIKTLKASLKSGIK